MSKLLITNALIVNENTILAKDLRIQDGKIVNIANKLSANDNEKVIDANGKHLIPGMIDSQVHFREPGLTHKADLHSESIAAVAGGITSYFDMPNVKPPTLDIKSLENKYNIAAQKSIANYAFYLGASNDNLEEIKRLPKNISCGVKVFMGASTGNMLVDNLEVLEQIFKHSPVIIATHCEDNQIIKQNEAKYYQQYGDNIKTEFHPLIRSKEACIKSSTQAIELANKYNSQLHILHISTLDELKLFKQGELQNKSITAEACIHFLHFCDKDYYEQNTKIKCNPAIKTLQDQQALIQAVKNNVIDLIATDHAPHTLQEKNQTYFKAPAGLPLVQHALLTLLEKYHEKEFSLNLIVEKTAHNVAKRFQIKERGYIKEGYFADLVLIDLNKNYQVTQDNILYKCKWSPFENYNFKSKIDTTIVNGNIVYQNDKVFTNHLGKRIQFDRK